MKPGERIWVRVLKTGGIPYRAWRPVVESASEECVVMFSEAGGLLYSADQTVALKHHCRIYFWPGRRHTLLEFYETDGRLRELYADITGPIEVDSDEIRFIDHELDVSMMAGERPRIVDQDEFAEAAERYGYTDDFIRESYALANRLIEVLANWTPVGVDAIYL